MDAFAAVGDSVALSVVAMFVVLSITRWLYYKIKLQTKFRVEGKQFLITGAAGGLGSCLCRELADKGASTLVMWDTRDAEMQQLKDELLKVNPKARILVQKVNLLDQTQIEQAFQEISDSKDIKIDVLVNNAGVAFCGAFDHISLDQEKLTMQVNFHSPVQLTKLFVPYFEKNGSGHIATVASLASYTAGIGLAAYCSSKFALRAYMEALTAELWVKKSPVTVSTFCPSVFSSKLFQGYTVPFLPPLSCEAVAQAFVYDSIERRFAISMYPKQFTPLPLINTFLNCLGFPLIIPFNPISIWKGASHVNESLGLKA